MIDFLMYNALWILLGTITFFVITLEYFYYQNREGLIYYIKHDRHEN